MGDEARTRSPEDERSRENARMAVEDAVYAMLEAGYTADEVKSEAAYAIESYEANG